jgi:hypothetical protein
MAVHACSAPGTTACESGAATKNMGEEEEKERFMRHQNNGDPLVLVFF